MTTSTSRYSCYFQQYSNQLIIYNHELKTSLVYDTEHNGISFDIDCEYDYRRNRKNKVAITKWLLKAWETLLMKYPTMYIFCSPYTEDGMQEYREEAYRKLGFVKTSEDIMVWGNLGYFYKHSSVGQQIYKEYIQAVEEGQID